jgi:chromate transport protein ChrA
MKLSPGTKRLIFTLIGLVISVLPVVIATVSYFPLWCARGGQTILSAFALILIIIAAVPLFRLLRTAFKSPASYTVWLVLFIIFFALSKIADEMVVISLIGFVSNLIGAIFFRLGKEKNKEG